MKTFLLIDTHATTPNLHEGSLTIEAASALDAAVELTGRHPSTLDVRPFGPAPKVWAVTAVTGEPFSLIVVQLTDR